MKKLLLAVLSIVGFSASASLIPVEFDNAPVEYPNQFRSGTAVLSPDNTEVSMQGNNWVAIEGNFTVLSDTVLSISFLSDMIGEVHGIGFDTDAFFSSDDLSSGSFRYFQFAGSQVFGNQDFNNYSTPGTEVTYTIDVGSYFTGNFNYLVLINDQDTAGFSAHSNYSIMAPPSFANNVSAPGALLFSGLIVGGLFLRNFRK